jgi:hypothetical protein
MKKITTLGLSLLIAMTVVAEKYALTYQGFPYNKTLCAGPAFAAGSAVRLTTGVPEKGDLTFAGWMYKGVVYAPGGLFTMPAEPVELLPAWKEELAIEQVSEPTSGTYKFIRNGQLVIVRDGAEYNAIGVRINGVTNQ